MTRRIFNLLQQDLTNALRDSILLYMMVAPLLLAFGASLFLPSIDQVTAVFAVPAQTDPAFVSQLRQYGRVEVYPSLDGVKERVLRMDDVVGFVPESGSYRLLLEGSEGPEAAELGSAVLAAVLSDHPLAEYQWTQDSTARSFITEYGTVVLVMIAILLGALVMAFNIIEDKETRAIRALGVSPLSMLELTLSRGLFAVILSFLLTIGTALILMGTSVNFGLLTVGFLFSIGLPVLLGYFVGGLADNQLKAIAILKFLMLIYISLPAVTIFIPRAYHVYFYILPNYWLWMIYENIFIGQLGPIGFWTACLVTLFSSLALVAFTMPLLRRQLKLR
jgi:ABC-2 type transport system permease protein